MKKRIKCSVCGTGFVPTKENIYQTYEPKAVGQLLTSPERTYDVIECPLCGCQAVLKVRMPKVVQEGDADD